MEHAAESLIEIEDLHFSYGELRVTSIVVTYDVSESLKVVDYAYLLHDGRVQAEGTAPDLLASDEPFVVQFLHARPTGPVAFHMKSAPYREDMGIG